MKKRFNRYYFFVILIIFITAYISGTIGYRAGRMYGMYIFLKINRKCIK